MIERFFIRNQKKIIFSLLLLLLILIFLSKENQRILNEPESRLNDPSLTADCGVVLTGSVGRIREAFEILAQKKIQKLIISGVYKEAQLLEIFPHLPFYSEISESDIILEKKSENTYGNAIQSLALVKALKCRDVLLITSQLHMFRAYRIFYQIYPPTISIKKMAVPNRKDFSFFDYLLETVKAGFYKILGPFLSMN